MTDRGRRGFVAASGALLVVFLASGTAIPLYNTYRVEDGITDGDLAATTVAYLGVTAVALLFLGRLSNHVGRKPVALAAVAVAVAGLVVLMNVHGLATLLVGRMLQGIACGMASSALGSWVIDLAPERPAWLPAVITSTAPPFSLPFGSLVAGALAEYGPAPRVLTFALVAVALLVLGAMLLPGSETVRRAPGAVASLRPRIHVPHGEARLLLAVGAGLVATWSFSGFYQAFSPSITADHLGTSNRLVIAVVFSSVIILSPFGGMLAARIGPPLAFRLGLAAFTVAAAFAVVSLHAGVIVPFLVASCLAGVSQGSANTAGMRLLLSRTAPLDRAGLLSTTYLVAYGGAAIPGLVGGRLTTALSLPDIAVGYVVLVAVAGAVAMLAVVRRPVPVRIASEERA